METCSDPDFITELPQSIIEIILRKLPIGEAVKTSILSVGWRYKWTSLTHIVFDDQSAPNLNNDQALVNDKIVNFITRCLLLHEGPIHKFSLSSMYLERSPNIGQWILFIARQGGLKELTIDLEKGECFRVPCSVFSCVGLTRLELSGCKLNPPPDFSGFQCMKYLSLEEVSISSDCINILISSCPLLDSLTLSYLDDPKLELTVRALNLKHLVLEGQFKDLRLESMPLLVDISFAIYLEDDIYEHLKQNPGCIFKKVLGGVPKLERLIGHGFFTEFMCMGNDERRSPIIFHHLKSVELCQVCFDDGKQVGAMLQIIVNSPNLETLEVSNNLYGSATEDHSMELWDEESFSDCTLRRLRTAKITEAFGDPHEMKFMEFLLEHSPSLEEMSFTPSIAAKEQELRLLIRLASFRRASPQASIKFCRLS